MFGFSIWWTPLLALLALVLVSSQEALAVFSNIVPRLAMRTCSGFIHYLSTQDQSLPPVQK